MADRFENNYVDKIRYRGKFLKDVYFCTAATSFKTGLIEDSGTDYWSYSRCGDKIAFREVEIREVGSGVWVKLLEVVYKYQRYIKGTNTIEIYVAEVDLDLALGFKCMGIELLDGDTRVLVEMGLGLINTKFLAKFESKESFLSSKYYFNMGTFWYEYVLDMRKLGVGVVELLDKCGWVCLVEGVSDEEIPKGFVRREIEGYEVLMREPFTEMGLSSVENVLSYYKILEGLK